MKRRILGDRRVLNIVQGYLFLGRIFYTLGEFEKSLTYYNIANLNNSGANTQFASQVSKLLQLKYFLLIEPFRHTGAVSAEKHYK